MASASAWPGDWHVLAPPHRDQRLDRAPVGLQRGDLLLRCPLQPDRTQRGISRVQGKVYAQEHACFVHVGLYGGGHHSHLQVAADALAGLADLSLAQRWAPVLRALKRAGRPRGAAVRVHSSAYCGSLVDDLSAGFAFRSIVDDQACFAPLPAAFSADQAQYENVAARW